MIGLLRCVGLLNGAVWFGAAFFFTFAAEPALRNSEAIKQLLEPKHYPYYSVALAQIVAARYFKWYLLCSVIALIHLAAEWLYFGKYPRRLWLGFMAGLCLAGGVQLFWLQPRLAAWHEVEFREPAQREAAGRTFRALNRISQGLNFALVFSLGFYLWRVASPSETGGFVRSAPGGFHRSTVR